MSTVPRRAVCICYVQAGGFSLLYVFAIMKLERLLARPCCRTVREIITQMLNIRSCAKVLGVLPWIAPTCAKTSLHAFLQIFADHEIFVDLQSPLQPSVTTDDSISYSQTLLSFAAHLTVQPLSLRLIPSNHVFLIPILPHKFFQPHFTPLPWLRY
jgi:hypothetical protein